MKKILFLLVCVFNYSINYCQTDTNNLNLEKYTNEFKFETGIFTDFEQAKNNSPIPIVRIITSYDTDDTDFFENLVSEKYIYIYDNLGLEKKIETDDIWGYCNNGVIYIQKNDKFNRLGVIGSISHFVAYETVYDNTNPYSYSTGYTDYGTYPTTSTELKQYLLSFQSGEVFDFNYKTVEILLMNDTELYDAFINLKKRDKKNLAFVYVRKYNEKNPLMLPVN